MPKAIDTAIHDYYKWYNLLLHPTLTIEGIRFLLQTNPLRSWFFMALLHQDDMGHHGIGPMGNYYEFGVGGGGSLTTYIEALRAFCRYKERDITKYNIFTFDSFEGLPEESDARDYHPMWGKGKIAFSLEYLKQNLGRKIDLTKGNVRFVKGYFKDTLTTQLRDELSVHPPSIITVDVDYYSSYKVVFDWLRPILPSGCLFVIDDIWSFWGNPNLGAPAAIREFNAQGDGWLIPYNALKDFSYGSRLYVYSRKKYEYNKQS